MATNVDIDREMCIGSGNCVHISGGAIDLDEEGVATVIDPATATVDQLHQAARSCPTAAITVEDEQ
jgi:ferredoxin